MNSGILFDFLNNRPSLMSYEDEIKLMEIMLHLSKEWIIKNKEEFIKALEELSCSHTTGNGFLLEQEKDDRFFEDFCNWLIELNNIEKIPTLKFIDDLSPSRLNLSYFRTVGWDKA